MKNELLMFQISNNLTKQEAISFASKLQKDEKYFLVKVFENPREKHISKREKYVVVRYPRRGESIKGSYAKLCGKKELMELN